MRKEVKNKLMPMLVTLILIFSMIAILPTSSLADAVVFNNEYGAANVDDMTCGDVLWVNGTDLTPDTRYYVYFETASGPAELLDDQRADDSGEVNIEVNVPYRTLGTWEIYLLDDTWANGGSNVTGSPDNVVITSVYEVRYKVGDEYLEFLILDKEYYSPDYVEISVWNWTGSKFELFEFEVDIDLYEPDGTFLYTETTSTGKWNLNYIFDFRDTNSFENYYLVDVTNVGTPALLSNAKLPVKLEVTASVSPSDPVWGDTITVEGYLTNGTGSAVTGYTVYMLAPSGSSFIAADFTDTFGNGLYSLSAPSDIGGASAGSWYIGTVETGTYRIDETDMVDYTDFISYFSFDVASDDNARVNLVSPDEVFSGFDQNLNVSVYNTSWDDMYYYDQMWVHMTGVEACYGGVCYDEDDIIVLGNFAMNGTGYSTNRKYAYYEFIDVKFNETGTVTIIVTYDMNNSAYEDIPDLDANITGSTTFQVVSPGDMNVIFEGNFDFVDVDSSHACCWFNDSNIIIINVFGDDQDTPMNASITITGCGLDIEVDEDDAVDDGYQTAGQTGIYNVPIQPKYAGTVSVTCENETENMSVTKDFSVSGLAGSVTTSDNDDLEISVTTTETIILTVSNGAYSEVHLCYYDCEWANEECLNETIGDNTDGNGLNGIFEFMPDVDDLDHTGYIVVAAMAGEYYIYDIVEVAPVHDLVVEIIDPDNASMQTLTAGLEHDWEFKIMDGNGDVVDDIESVTAEILDDDGDAIQEYDLKEKAGNIWYMDEWIPHFTGELLVTAVNNTCEDEHDGNITFDIDCALITYSPEGVTAGVDWENITVEVFAVDANGMPVPDGTRFYINVEESDSIDIDSEFTVDENGEGEFDIAVVGDNQTEVNVSLQDAFGSSEEYWGNETCGTFFVNWPTFMLEPDMIFIGQANQVTITVMDYNGVVIPEVNLTLYGSMSQFYGGVIPDPAETGNDGKATVSVEPVASGKLNVTIVRNISYIAGVLTWYVSDAVITDTYITVTSLKQLKIGVSKSPIFEDETLTITVTTGGMPVADVDVEFGEETMQTDADGKATFTVPDPGVESAVYSITAEKTGYVTEDKSITVIKIYGITIIGPSSAPGTGETFTITALARGSALAGATISFDGKTFTTGADGTVSLTAPSTEGTYTVTGSYEDYEDVTFDVTITAGGIPGFELFALIAALGIAFILFRRRR